MRGIAHKWQGGRRALIVRASVATTFLAVLLGFPPAATAAFPGVNGKLAIVHRESGEDDEILVTNLNGSGQVRLTDNSVSDQRPAWSPDGARIAFQRGTSGGVDVFVMNANGSGQTQLTTNGRSSQPAWSPDGERIAFSSGGVAVMNADGSGKQQLTLDGIWPAWSPGGASIAFHASGAIFVMNADGSGRRRLTDAAFEGQPDWSPDGRKIAFASGEFGEIFVINPDGTRRTRLTQGGGAQRNLNPAWSPDTTRIAFVSDELVCPPPPSFGQAQSPCSPGPPDLYLMLNDGSTRKRLTFGPVSTQPAWQRLPATMGGVDVFPDSFRASNTVRAAVGATVHFSMTGAGHVRFSFQRGPLPGRLERTLGGRSICRPTTARNRSRPSCSRYATQGDPFVKFGYPGAQRFAFNGRVHPPRLGRRLDPGAYRVQARVVGNPNSERSATFRILPGPTVSR